MTPHLLILPVVLPFVAGILQLLLADRPLALRRGLSLAASVLLLPIAAALLVHAGDGIAVYRVGDWPAPFGIVLVLDRLAALMVTVLAVLALPCLVYACRGTDTHGRDFHALFHFQLMGINGAFLTGDLFNLFVFFEVLLIASYALLLHGGGAQRTRAGLHYVVLNLTGSALFLIAMGVLYGVLGTLNMADLAERMRSVDPQDVPLVKAGASLLLVVFGLKAALLPLYFWLPGTYSAAPAPVAALFAIMTKVGIYSILRVSTLMFSGNAALASLGETLLWPLSLLTIALGAIGVLAARTLGRLTGYLVVVSAGTLLAGIAISTEAMLQATLYYLIHTTWMCAGLFLLAEVIALQRGEVRDRFVAGPALTQPHVLGMLLLVGAVASIGMPPLSGFIGKALLLRATPMDQAVFLWSFLLVSSLLMLLAFSRAGTTLVWRGSSPSLAVGPSSPLALGAVTTLFLLSPLLVGLGTPVLEYTSAAARQLLDPQPYLQAVLVEAGRVN
jgi:multicomponent K+:H+ antiporter subunit D